MLLCVAPGVASAQQYVMTLLGFAPYSYTINGVNGLNNNGDVVGYDSVIDGAYLYHGGVVSALGMTSGVGVAINNSGYIAVRSWGPDQHSYLYTPGRLPRLVSHFTDIGTLGGSGGLNNTGQTVAMDMNDSRTIVGASTVSGATPPLWHAFSWSNGQMTDLGVLQLWGMSTANSINNLGQIVGDTVGNDGYDRAFQMVNGYMTDMDPANHNYDSSAVAINDAGQIVVVTNLAWRIQFISRGVWSIVAYRGPTYYTRIYSNGTYTDLGNLGYTEGTYGYSINSAGDVVGYSLDSNNRAHAFLYHAGTMVELNNVVTNLSGWRVSIATRINDLGQIVCWVRNNTTNEAQTAVLTPILD